MEQPIGLSGHRPIQPRFNRIEVGLPRTKASLQSHNCFELKVNLYKHCLKPQAIQACSESQRKKLTRDYTRRES
jgi:hypothetical protein